MEIFVSIWEYLEGHICFVNASVEVHELLVFKVGILQSLNDKVSCCTFAVVGGFPRYLSVGYDSLASLVISLASSLVALCYLVYLLDSKLLYLKLDNLAVFVLEGFGPGSCYHFRLVFSHKVSKVFHRFHSFKFNEVGACVGTLRPHKLRLCTIKIQRRIPQN